MKCIKCGMEIADNALYCSACGAKQAKVYRQVFARNGHSERNFIEYVNQWLQSDPRRANVSCKFDTGTSLGLMANKSKLNQIEIEYELLDGMNQNVYCLVREESNAIYRKNTDKFIEQWKQNHPGVTVVTWTCTYHGRGKSSSLLLGGVGAWNRINAFILCKFPRR